MPRACHGLSAQDVVLLDRRGDEQTDKQTHTQRGSDATDHATPTRLHATGVSVRLLPVPDIIIAEVT